MTVTAFKSSFRNLLSILHQFHWLDEPDALNWLLNKGGCCNNVCSLSKRQMIIVMDITG